MGSRRHANIEPQHPPSSPYCHSNILGFLPKWPPAKQLQASSPGVRPRHSRGVAKCSCSRGRGGQSLDVQTVPTRGHLRLSRCGVEPRVRKAGVGLQAKASSRSPCATHLSTNSKVSEDSTCRQQLPGGYVGTLVRAGW